MRHACLALVLMLWAPVALAFEIEDHRLFPGTGDTVLRILSTTDLAVFEPWLLAYQASRPSLSIDYTVVSSADLDTAIRGGAAFDLALSSAMDLQFRLANDGFARPHRSETTDALPDWARWRDLIFAFTAETAVVLISSERFAGLPLPETRQDLITLLRQNPDRFQGAVATYDVRESGLGYLFATQEARATDAYWRLSEVMGRLDPMLSCCSGQMIEGVLQGRLALAYNVLGSYATDRMARESGGRVQILRMTDFANVVLRTAIIPRTATAPRAAGDFIDSLIRSGLGRAPADWPFPALSDIGTDATSGFGPIRLGPALMVYLDQLNRRAFLQEWQNAMEDQ